MNMKIQLPTIIVLCLGLVLFVTFTFMQKGGDGRDRESLNLESEEFKLMRKHGKAAFDTKKYKQAIQIYEEALRMRPENAEVHNDLGATYYAFGLEYAGPSWPAWDGDLAGKTKKEALQELNTAIDQTGSGYVVLKTDKPEVAEAIIEKAKGIGAYIETQPWKDYTEIHILVGKTKDFLLKARNSYIRSTDIKPTYSPAYRNLGSLYMKIGRTDLALSYLENAYQLDPRDEELGEYLSQFK